jgi:hypothetical protein
MAELQQHQLESSPEGGQAHRTQAIMLTEAYRELHTVLHVRVAGARAHGAACSSVPTRVQDGLERLREICAVASDETLTAFYCNWAADYVLAAAVTPACLPRLRNAINQAIVLACCGRWGRCHDGPAGVHPLCNQERVGPEAVEQRAVHSHALVRPALVQGAQRLRGQRDDHYLQAGAGQLQRPLSAEFMGAPPARRWASSTNG